MKYDFDKLYELFGQVSKEHIACMDYFIGEHIGLFMPSGIECLYTHIPPHSHPSYMFMFSLNNQNLLKINEGILNVPYRKILALSPDTLHKELPSESPPRNITIFINRNFFEALLPHYNININIFFRGELYGSDPNLLYFLKKYMIEADNNMPGSKFYLHILSMQICHVLIRNIFNLMPDHDRVSYRMEIKRVVDYMNLNLEKKISINEMADTANMSLSHFSRIFKKETGKTPIDFLNQIRLERVKKYLLARDKSITEIAYECGFNSSSYLSAIFCSKYNMSPSEYQKCNSLY